MHAGELIPPVCGRLRIALLTDPAPCNFLSAITITVSRHEKDGA